MHGFGYNFQAPVSVTNTSLAVRGRIANGGLGLCCPPSTAFCIAWLSGKAPRPTRAYEGAPYSCMIRVALVDTVFYSQRFGGDVCFVAYFCVGGCTLRG